MTPDDPRHGTVAGYVAGCRQECCRAATRENTRRTRARRYLYGPLTIDGTGTRRRLQALVALGWSLRELDVELGRRNSYCSYLLADDARPVHRTVADQVIALYDHLSMVRPEGWLAERQRRLAARRGWVPPLAWDDIDDPDEVANVGGVDDGLDPVVVDRILAGDWRLSARLPERLAVLGRWQTEGLTDNEVERRTGWNVARDVRPHLPRTEAAA